MKQLILVMSLFTAGFAYAHEAETLAPLTEFTLADGRTIVTDGQNRTVYTFDVDSGSTSNCYDGCAVAWPPVLVEASVQVSAPVGKTSRRDGSLQLTVDGKPVYYYVSDSQAGDINGDGLQGVWHIIEH